DKGMGVMNDVSEADPLSQTQRQELKKILAEAVSELSQKEQLVVSMYYVEELTLKEIGQVLDLTESRISQIHSRILLSLRKKLMKAGIIDNE
ncbi:MAG: sigma-70 family RNA polymerase sigma factor, partial [Desulfatirhabdiaceae bacterium]